MRQFLKTHPDSLCVAWRMSSGGRAFALRQSDIVLCRYGQDERTSDAGRGGGDARRGALAAPCFESVVRASSARVLRIQIFHLRHNGRPIGQRLPERQVCAGRGRRIAIDVQWTPDRYTLQTPWNWTACRACHMRISGVSVVSRDRRGEWPESYWALAHPPGSLTSIVRIVLSTSFL